jgi:ABC-2 type transport system ATP-binding protein
VLVVDEPMVGLDPHSIRLVKDLLQREVACGMCVLMSTHTLTAAEEISNRVGIMSHGRLMFDGTIDELRERFPEGHRSLESMYLAMTEDRAKPQAAKTPLDKLGAEQAAEGEEREELAR